MKQLILMLLAFGLVTNLNAQNIENESYLPLVKGFSKTLTWYNSKYREVVKDSVSFSGKTYMNVSQVFPQNNTMDMYLRHSNDTIYFYNKKDNVEFPFFGIRPEVGQTIGRGTIKEVNGKLKTPKGKLNDLLVIEMNYPNGQTDTRYYKKGLGLVAVTNEKGLICYYIPD